eukprot:TRINITY_DN31027_c0_g1_i2.p1 TRINITY_DN31027_c0_g1~~TRINITY_DN31027_c0_g1_i2.p1  ORF type:complete len:105 (-),score=18.78 TRINITY_DN31027_c0_g1_i2:303-617(-)
MHPDQLSEMMAQFTKYADRYKYNEVVVDGGKWNGDVSNNLWAFIVPTGAKGECASSDPCYTSFVTWYKDFQAKYGRKTILGLDVTNKDAPFSPFPQPTDATVVV